MTIIKIWGGLGNQMFQAALGMSMSAKGYDVKYDKSWLMEHKDIIGENVIDEVFCVQLATAEEAEIQSIKRERTNVLVKIGRKIGLLRQHYLFEPESYRGEYQHQIVNNAEDMYLEGYWQAEEYFQDIKEDIIKAFQWKKKLNQCNMDWYQKIQETKDSVAVHIRLGDYNNPENYQTFGGICTPDYYKRAFEYIEQKISNPVYYLFSNEPQKAKSILEDRQYYIIDCNDGLSGWNDMVLMTACSNLIIANSTFSWWGAYLNQNPQKIVITPMRWTNNSVRKGMYVEGWVKQ